MNGYGYLLYIDIIDITDRYMYIDTISFPDKN